jgi:hypothetical protein
MSNIEDVRYGWNFMAKLLGADLGGQTAYSDYVQNVADNSRIQLQNNKIREINNAIDELTQNISALNNSHPGIGPDQLKGFVAEEWHAQTFNIDAISKDSANRAWTLKENGYASVDIDTNFGKQYSLKYSNYADKAEQMQAALNRYTHRPKYHGQERLIAAEQVQDAKAAARRRAIRNSEIRPDVSQSHSETGKHLLGKVSDGKGVESKELSIKESKTIAREVRKKSFDAEKHGYEKQTPLNKVQIDYLNQAMKAGLTAATISAIVQLVPELYKAIDFLIKHGEIDLNGITQSGKKVISVSAESFLRGSIAYGIEMSIQKGLLGEAVKAVTPTIVGAAVTIVLGTIKDSIYVAAGKMSEKEMGMRFIDSMIISSGYLASMKIGGIIAQALCPQLPGIGYAIGSLLGCSVAVVYSIGKKKLISFCVDTGFTCFGLVDQNYQIPEEALKELGVETISIPHADVERTRVNTISTQQSLDTVQYDTIDIKVLKRGIIGVNRVGYVC